MPAPTTDTTPDTEPTTTPRWTVEHLRFDPDASLHRRPVPHATAPPTIGEVAHASFVEAFGGEHTRWYGLSTLRAEQALVLAAMSRDDRWRDAVLEVAEVLRWTRTHGRDMDELGLAPVVTDNGQDDDGPERETRWADDTPVATQVAP